MKAALYVGDPTTLSLAVAGAPLGGLAHYVGGNIQTELSPSVFQTAVSLLLLISGSALLVRSA